MPDFSILTNNIDMYLEGFKYTVMSSVLALIGSFILGVILAVMRIAPIRILNWLGACYCRICKKYSARINCIYILFRFTCSRNYSKWFCSRNSYAYRIYCSVYCGSHSRWYFIRCKRSNGSSTFLRINVCTGNVLYCFTPGDENRNPSFRKSISQFSKNSSILGVIAGADLMYQGDLISTKTFVTFDVYIFVGMFYLILTIPLSMLVRYLEKRLAKEAV